MPLEFVGDAISLSGLTGTKIKSEIIGEYYPFWWNITSGGDRNAHRWWTAIIELDAATGETYVKDTIETILGSSGHALNLKCDGNNKGYFEVILIEKDADCFSHLKNVIKRRWPQINITEAEGPIRNNHSHIFLWNIELEEALNRIALLDLRNSLFFFDPLRGTTYEILDKVGQARIKNYYQTGTEFMIFVFTSDWFLGRDDFTGLPTTIDERDWSEGEKKTVAEADALFGNIEWRPTILNKKTISEKEPAFIDLYRKNLHKWFRYVLPMPFNPKDKQIYHLILCSNFEAGVRATRGFFCEKTNNPDYKPDNAKAYAIFKSRHPELFVGLRGIQRPKEWKILWSTIKGHEEGICDFQCKDFIEIEQEDIKRVKLLAWLAQKGYLIANGSDNPWKLPIMQYMVNWPSVHQILDINPPLPLQPLSLKPLSLKEINR
jgi:three-Cys-motif partner protein